ncbi:hypothetical protein BHU24_25760 [Bacillus pseudomycoides]|uniref:DUF2871 domain-containing protein n=1 Tax=Bacillus pseudomycoides TaxID=64104 RepID=A0AAJ1Z5Y6_9BACI|nr:MULTISPECIES: DUF2871 family protein [Bacillus cereus group]EEM04847.1 hypothetical protein bmyco0002_26450 [Bacillus pseudomycoides]MBD5797360.1 hypothetical protein [Bacillus pseudomycoides]MBJ8029348.1 DUF2871 family protein [Bacillus cereus group sp. N21]MCR8860497.1 DUF2871 domain-containing protein [Bacillus pseudomycoides]MDR4326991.1 DUF2871 family protein [Bacillus pseudomycoides]
MKKLYYASFVYLVIGLLSGVFAREYAKSKGILGSTLLNLLHTHTLVLGFLFFLIALALAKSFAFHKVKGFNMWFIVHNIGLILTLSSLATRGLLQLNGADFKGLAYIVGISHSIIGLTLIWFMMLLKKSYKM